MVDFPLCPLTFLLSHFPLRGDNQIANNGTNHICMTKNNYIVKFLLLSNVNAWRKILNVFQGKILFIRDGNRTNSRTVTDMQFRLLFRMCLNPNFHFVLIVFF